jgi:DNA-binding MarR family transcriptional regulator
VTGQSQQQDAPSAADAASVEHIRGIEQELRRLFRRTRAFYGTAAAAVQPPLDDALYTLLMLVAAEAPVRSVDLAQRRSVSKSVISRQVAALTDLGLLARHEDPTDARAAVIVLTEAGRQAADAVNAARRAYLGRLFHGLTQDDLAQIAYSLGRLNDALD